jgi:hypothetical protein
MSVLIISVIISVIIILAACTMVLMAPLSLEIDTREQKYVLMLAWFFRIQYGCPQRQRCLRFSLFGYSWASELRWPALDKKKLKHVGEMVVKERENFSEVLRKMKDSWCDLQRLSSRKLELNLCTPDFMANALLSLIFAEIFAARKIQGVRISVNYREENWLVGYFITRLWAVGWVSLKFALSRPVSRLGFSAIRSHLR